MREEGGVRALYRGMVPTALGVAPYVGESPADRALFSPLKFVAVLGINFAAYEALRGVITPPGKSSVTRKLACGALAGSISQTLTYPFDVIRRKMQVSGMSTLGVKYNGALDALQHVVRTEGISGLYRGLWPNLRECLLTMYQLSIHPLNATVKVAPSIATSFFTYELVKELLGAS